jgi:phosphoribosylanthranilate isomerase
MGLRIKICGITKPEQGRAIAHLGATALGFICASESPRYVTPEQICAVVRELPMPCDPDKRVDRIGVFVNASLEMIGQTVEIGCLSGVQLHGNESPEFCDRLRQVLPAIEIIKALRVRSSAALEDAQLYEDRVDALLLDAYHPSLAGGTGQTLDWSTLQQFRPTCPWLLAGGLTPDNVVDALTHLSPDGIDLSSGVERAPGDKDLDKVMALFRALQQAARA